MNTTTYIYLHDVSSDRAVNFEDHCFMFVACTFHSSYLLIYHKIMLRMRYARGFIISDMHSTCIGYHIQGRIRLVQISKHLSATFHCPSCTHCLSVQPEVMQWYVCACACKPA